MEETGAVPGTVLLPAAENSCLPIPRVQCRDTHPAIPRFTFWESFLRLRTMRPERKALAATVLVLGALLLVLLITPATAHWLRRREFEWKVRSKMDPIKLQSWATDLLERFPPQHGFYLDLFGTNLPPGMADIKGYTHMVRLVMGEE